jgi:CSLREA domain-containing protein
MNRFVHVPDSIAQSVYSSCFQHLIRIGVVIGLLFFSVSSISATFAVNNLGDTPDATPGDGICATAGNVCTLRAAIDEANALAGDDQITVPVGTIIVGSELQIFSNLSISSAGALTRVSGNTATRVFQIAGSNPIVSFTNLEVTEGRADRGGGIRLGSGALNLLRSRVSSSAANSGDQLGGGIYVSGGRVTLQASLVDINSGNGGGGGVYVSGTGELVLIESTVQNNAADGVGIVGGGILSEGSVTTLNSTITLNRASNGAGIAIVSGSANIEYTTIVANNATAGGQISAAVPNTQGLTRRFRANIIANPTGGANCSGTTLANAVSTGGNNLESASSCGFAAAGDLVNTNPLLGALGSCATDLNQGYALLAGSPAINAGPTTGALPISDQSGTSFIRVINAPGDIGACEFANATTPGSTTNAAVPIPPLALALMALALMFSARRSLLHRV